MSYQIYYDRAFIRVNDEFIPMVNSGSSNCFEYLNGREVPEKNWSVLNWKRSGRVLFPADEIRGIAREYDSYNQESGMMFKSRNRIFEAGEFERWVINGMKSAYTAEEYRAFGNDLYVLDCSASKTGGWTKHRFSTTGELLSILDQLGSVKGIDVGMSNNREVYRPVSHKPRGPGLRADELSEYYVLGGIGAYADMKGRVIYLVNLRPSGIRYLRHQDSCLLKVFRTERDAERYVEKYASRLKQFADFKPVLVPNAGGV